MRNIILDLCGGTGSWSRPYLYAGYTVHNITLPNYDVVNHFFSDGDVCFPGIGADVLNIPIDEVYGILAAPPCTMFSVARRTAKLPPDYVGALKIVDACLDVIRKCTLDGNLKFWAMENPRGKLRYFLGKPKNTFYQWQFGGQHKKPSDIWGYYNDPRPLVKKEPVIDVDKNWQKPECPPELSHLKLNRTAIRAITPSGFAMAFYKENQ